MIRPMPLFIQYVIWFDFLELYCMVWTLIFLEYACNDCSGRVLKWYPGWLKYCSGCELTLQPGSWVGLRSDLGCTHVRWDCKGALWASCRHRRPNGRGHWCPRGKPSSRKFQFRWRIWPAWYCWLVECLEENV